MIIKVKQFFCMHLSWKKYTSLGWRPEYSFGLEVYECNCCGKVKGFKRGNPPIIKIV